MEAPPSPGQRLRLNPLSLRQVRGAPLGAWDCPVYFLFLHPGELLFFGNNLSPVGWWDVLEIALHPHPLQAGL